MIIGVQVTVAFAIAAAATEIFTEHLVCVKSYVKHLYDFCHFTKPKTFFLIKGMSVPDKKCLKAT